MRFVDLFCGCGGMSWGLQQDGCELLLGIDNEKNYIKTFEENFGSDKTLLADIKIITGKDILEKINLKKGELELLVGGPPCQGFSKNTPVSKRDADSENNLLIHEFLRITKEIKPKNIVIENVAEMKRGFGGKYTSEIITKLNSMGYFVINHIFDASDFGTPQKRKRAFFIGSLEKKDISVPAPTHFDKDNPKKSNRNLDLFPGQKTNKITIKDAISDLPNLKHGQGEEISKYISKPQNDYQKYMRINSKKVSNHISRKLSNKQFERYSSLKPGEGNKQLPDHLRTKGGYSGAYGRLTWDSISPTITRWVFHPGSGRWGHPKDIRSLSIREIARIQRFSDDFVFKGTFNEICGQLGNAVPPLLMKTVVSCLRD